MGFGTGWVKRTRGALQRGSLRGSGRFYRRSLILILLTACVPGLITGLLVYGWVTAHMEKVLRQIHVQQIEQRAANIEEQFADLELSFSQWAFDPVFDQRLKELDFVYKYKQVHELYRTLLIIGNSNPLIGNVQLYLNHPKPLTMTADRYTFLTDAREIGTYEQMEGQVQATYWTLSPDGRSLVLVNRLPGGSDTPAGLLTMTVDSAQMSGILQSLTPYSNGATFLLNDQGGWLVPPAGSSPGLNEAVRMQVLNRKTSDGSFSMTYDGNTYSVESGTFSRLGAKWTYVSAAPLTEIVSPLLSASKMILAINAAGLLLALLLSWFGSLRLYAPVRSLVSKIAGGRLADEGGRRPDEFEHIERSWIGIENERARLLGDLERQRPLLRESFLLQLAQGHLQAVSEADLRERFGQLGWPLEGEKFIVMMARIRRTAVPRSFTGNGSEEVLAFRTVKLLRTQVQQLPYSSEVLNFHDLSVGILLNVPASASESEIRLRLRDTGLACVEAARKQLNARMDIVIGSMFDEAGRISDLFSEARQALKARLQPGPIPVTDLTADELQPEDGQQAYPLQQEQEIIAAIRSGGEDQAVKALEGFMERLTSGSPGDRHIRQGMLQLLISIRQAMGRLGEETGPLFGMDLFEELLQLNHLDEITLWFRERVILECIRGYTGREEKQIQLAVHQIKEHADSRYAEALSLEELADLHGIHSYALSKAFKQNFSLNFVDYLTGVRLSRSKELLRDTDFKVNEIAERVGYQPSYFNRIFKKNEGVTPNRYREMARERESLSRGNGSG